MGFETLAGGKKNARRRRAWIVFQDESGVSQRPSIRRTWAPKGETPVLVHAFNWKKMSIATALAFSWDGKRSRLFFQTKPDSYNTASLIGFLKALKREFRGRNCIVIWDGLRLPRFGGRVDCVTHLPFERPSVWAVGAVGIAKRFPRTSWAARPFAPSTGPAASIAAQGCSS